jgi:hypothetical protein
LPSFWAGGHDRAAPGSPASAYITIPAALRRRCGLEAGDQVLLAALPDQDSLAAYSLAVVDAHRRTCAPRSPRSPPRWLR